MGHSRCHCIGGHPIRGGEQPLEFQASEIPLGQRGRRLEESVDQLRALWAGEPIDEAEHPHMSGVRIAPRPPRVPLLFGGHTPVALRRAARLGDAWVGFHKDEAQFAEALAILRDERAAIAGRTGVMPTGMVLPTLVTERNEGAPERAAELIGGASTKDFGSAPDRFVLAGTPERVLDRIASYHASGCEHFILAVLDQGDAYQEQLAAICSDVAPGVRALGRAEVSGT